MNKFTRMLLILFITIAGSGTASGLDRLDRFIKREGRKLERIEKRRLKYEIRKEEGRLMTPRESYRKCDGQRERIDLYQDRHSMAQDIFTGEPLTGDNLKDWKELKFKQKMTKQHVR